MSLRVCYFGTYRANYSRNQIMIAGLQAVGVEVVECHTTLWHGVEDRVKAVSGGWKHPRFWWRVLRAYGRLLRQYRSVGDYDVMFVGYPGQFDVYLARWLTRRRRKPLVWDIFMSIYLIAEERGLVDRHPRMGWFIQGMERRACHLPDLLILDTHAYVDWFNRTYGVAPERFRLVPTGVDDRVFRPLNGHRSPDSKFTAVYYGTFIPNHGVEYIIEAARILQSEDDIHFELIGQGPCRAEAEARARRYGLTNVTFVDWVDKQALPRRVAQANVCLGAFGTTPQSMMTVQNKIYEGLAMGQPVITGDAPTIHQVLTADQHLLLCERANPEALAEAILRLHHDPDLQQRLARNGYRIIQEKYTVRETGKRIKTHLLQVLSKAQR